MSVTTSMGRIGNYNNYMNAPATKVRCGIYWAILQLHECFGTALQCTLSNTILLARKGKLNFRMTAELLGYAAMF
jgi:hypothetical protein